MRGKTLLSIITPDRRSIAAFRFLLGLGLVFDLSNRLANAPYFYGEQGLLPRALWERYYGDRAYYWTLHFFSHEWLFTAAVALQIGLALCLLLGYRVRLASALGWVLMLSLVLRNPLLFYGGDKLAPLLLLLSAFLPVTSRTKWAAARRTPLLFHLSYVALLVQTAVLYIVSGESKLASRYWQEGSALNNVLEMNLLVLPLGQWFGQFDPLLHLMSLSVPWAEIILPLLFLLPFWDGRVRMLAVLGLLGLNIGIFLMLDVGYFMFYASACLIGLLPSVFWEGLGQGWRYLSNLFNSSQALPWLSRSRTAASTDPETSSPYLLSRLGAGVASVFLLALMGVTLATGLESMKLVKLSYPPGSWTLIRGINAYQNWGLFTNPGTTATWYVSKAQLADGRWVDLLQEGDAVTWSYQSSPNALYKRNSKWRLAMAKINSFDDKQALLYAFGNAITARWEARQGEAVQNLTIYRLSQRLPIKTQDPDWSEWLVWWQ